MIGKIRCARELTELKRWKVRNGERVVESEIGEHEVSESLKQRL